MRCKFIILLFALSSLVSAQINYRNSSWYIKGNASSLIDIFSFPTVQLSVEKQFSEYISLCAEGGYQLYSFSRSDTSFLNPTGFKVNLEFRYYLSRFITTRLSNKLGRVYTGIRPFYWQTRYNASVSFQTNLEPSRWYDDDFGVKNKTLGLGIVLGFQKSITERLILDLHTGVAIMNRSIENIELDYKSDSGYLLAGTELIKYFKRLNLNEASGISANAMFGFRLGYTIYK